MVVILNAVIRFAELRILSSSTARMSYSVRCRQCGTVFSPTGDETGGVVHQLACGRRSSRLPTRAFHPRRSLYEGCFHPVGLSSLWWQACSLSSRLRFTRQPVLRSGPSRRRSSAPPAKPPFLLSPTSRLKIQPLPGDLLLRLPHGRRRRKGAGHRHPPAISPRSSAIANNGRRCSTGSASPMPSSDALSRPRRNAGSSSAGSIMPCTTSIRRPPRLEGGHHPPAEPHRARNTVRDLLVSTSTSANGCRSTTSATVRQHRRCAAGAAAADRKYSTRSRARGGRS